MDTATPTHVIAKLRAGGLEVKAIDSPDIRVTVAVHLSPVAVLYPDPPQLEHLPPEQNNVDTIRLQSPIDTNVRCMIRSHSKHDLLSEIYRYPGQTRQLHSSAHILLRTSKCIFL